MASLKNIFNPRYGRAVSQWDEQRQSQLGSEANVKAQNESMDFANRMAHHGSGKAVSDAMAGNMTGGQAIANAVGHQGGLPYDDSALRYGMGKAKESGVKKLVGVEANKAQNVSNMLSGGLQRSVDSAKTAFNVGSTLGNSNGFWENIIRNLRRRDIDPSEFSSGIYGGPQNAPIGSTDDLDGNDIGDK